MQTLNLSGTSKESDGFLKRLFWPTVENAWDVDALGVQGFWLCFILGSANFIFCAGVALVAPVFFMRVFMLAGGGILFLTYFIGGMGVRQANWGAALAIFTFYVASQIATKQIPSFLSFIFAGILLSNVRATFLASRWQPASEDEDRPTRFNETFRDKLVDQWPQRAWPVLKYPFYVLDAILLLLLMASMVLQQRNGAFHSLSRQHASPSVVVRARGSY
jgi:hypothetical protein